MLFDGWGDLVRIIVVGMLGYASLIILLRITGKRTLSKMNAFDFVVTIAIGSVLANLVLSPETALADGVAALGTLVLLQWIVAWMSARFGWFLDLVKARPRLLFKDGKMLERALVDERVAPAEIFAAIRAAGHAGTDSVHAVVLETDGSFSVVDAAGERFDAMQNVVSSR